MHAIDTGYEDRCGGAEHVLSASGHGRCGHRPPDLLPFDAMSLTFAALASAVGLFAGMLICFEAGRRIGIARLARDPGGIAKGAGAVEAATFGLLGLLLAFTFSGLSLTLYVILDLEFPRPGLIRIDAADQALIDLRNSLR